MESLLLQILAIVFGACVGSFLNVVVYRVPAGISLVSPPSHCPKCETQLKPRDNIPIVGWFLIGGKCRYCKAPVSWRYPLVETITAFLFWCIAWRFGFSVSIALLATYGLFVSWLISLSLIDFDTMTLPNVLTQSGLVAGLAVQITKPWIAPALSGNSANHLLAGIAGAVVGIWLLDAMRVLGSIMLDTEAMGAGDAKLAAMIGAWLGWQKVLLAIVIAAALGSIAGILAIALGKLLRRQAFPFGPFLAIGGFLSLLFGTAVINTYLQWFGLG
ncbi:type 4 prepilin peptidase 1 [Thalassoporum mexicanum PCC 7367]|uniref:prepilin peptidase n=1 Tax=Thalassoporum mexicanum TaxID=3457544 RepID=UPI00029F9900|nr:A24 family peptidase [Pseudanabaena sp. PCC 7367]AFY68358.1 type 4 prepilin peptidase 1 [Pseudanabaena sp. PCC 7367]